MAVVSPPSVSERSEVLPHPVPRWSTSVEAPLRVLMIAWEPPSGSAPAIGVPGEGLVEGLRERGAEIVLLLGGRSARTETRGPGAAALRLRIIASFPPRLRRTSVRSHGEQLLDEVSRLSSVARIVAGEDRFDLIHAHDWMSFPAAVAARDASGCPFVAHVHATQFAGGDAGEPDPTVTRLEGEGLRRADRVICASNVAAAVVNRRYRVSESRIRVVLPVAAGGAPAAQCLEIYREVVERARIA